MIGVLKESQVGIPVAEVIRKAGISEQTFYRWKAKYAGLEVDEGRKIAQLQEENTRLKGEGESPAEPFQLPTTL
jgi:putative transposase